MSNSNKINYVCHRGNNRVAIVLCPNICRRFLHFSKVEGAEESWVLRDYIGNGQIVRRNHPDAAELKDIEKEILLSLDTNRVLNEKHEDATWKKYLQQLSQSFINDPDLSDDPLQRFAECWEPLGNST